MAETCYGKAAVSTAVTALKAGGWIRETRKGSGVSGNASVFELVDDAPNPPSSSPTDEQPTQVSSSPTDEQPTQVSSSPTDEQPTQVVRLEQYPSDPGLSDPGSDPHSSDQEEVQYSLNHREDQDETGLESRSLADDGSTGTESVPETDDGRGLQGPSLVSRATGTAEASSSSATASASWFDDPFANEPAHRAQESATETEVVDWSQYEPGHDHIDTSAKGKAIRDHVPSWRS
jgi:hypothetical protein